MSRLSILFTTGDLGGLERRIINSTRIFKPSFILFAEPSPDLKNAIGPNHSITVIPFPPAIVKLFPPFIHLYYLIKLTLLFVSKSSKPKHYIVSTSLYGSYYALLLSFYLKSKHIAVIGTSSYRFNAIHRFFLRLSLRMAHLILTNSVDTYRLFSTYNHIVFTFDRPMHLLRPSLDPTVPTACNLLRMTVVANMRPIKNPQGTARFLNLLAEKHPNITFAFVGRSMENLVKHLSTQALNVSSDFGSLSYIKTMEILSHSHFMLSLSKHEGMPNAVLDALSLGILPILSDIAPHRELMSNGYQKFLVDIKFIDQELERLLPFIDLKNSDSFKSQKPFFSVSSFVMSSSSTESVLNHLLSLS
jgi:glycosyltransferase involved in cell wall biosynthesis|tara:strand:- start:113 stop:1192 length:1080 start_codon:yes stop_codon:yes gene_type:complete